MRFVCNYTGFIRKCKHYPYFSAFSSRKITEGTPLILRYGTEKARWVAILITFLTFASVGALNGLVNDVKTVAAAVLSLALTGILALTIITTAVSILLSLKFYRENR